MPFKKGEINNPLGRPKGSKSEKTLIWEEVGEWFVSEGMEAYKERLDEMLTSSNKAQQMEGMKRFEALLEYFKPKLSRSEGTVEHKGDIPISINKTYKKDE